MGGDWIDVCPMLNEPMYFEIEKSSSNYMQEKWEEYMRSQDAPAEEEAIADGQTASGHDSGGIAVAPQTQAGKSKGKGTKAGKSSHKGSKGGKASKAGAADASGQGEPAAKLRRAKSSAELDDAPPSGKKGRTELDDLLKIAAQVKVYYHQVVGGAESLVSTIDKAPEPVEGVKGWGWAKTQVHSLKATLAQIKGKVSEVGEVMLITDLGKVKKKYDTTSLAAECRNFNELRSDVQKIEFEHNKLMDQNEIQNRDMATTAQGKPKQKKHAQATE